MHLEDPHLEKWSAALYSIPPVVNIRTCKATMTTSPGETRQALRKLYRSAELSVASTHDGDVLKKFHIHDQGLLLMTFLPFLCKFNCGFE